MAILKCKMCGGDLVVEQGITVAECEYCGTRQTVPKADDEKKLTLFGRAGRLRAACEFDKAAGIYESIVADFPEEAEAYWGLVLCKYGIEYVDDPATGKKLPTCHRSSFESIMEDSDFEQALENADGIARRVYREEAKQIETLRKDIIAVSANEQPYDIFICYKETDESGDRTLDSVLAQDVYDALTAKGYRVFFSRITLEDKLGMEYEPYIFAALNSAKIMLSFGTDYEYFNAVWVKNEWGRFLKLMAKDKQKHLIPCYKGIDAYDMPKEFAKLQAQDMGKVGAIQDLLRGIEKILPRQQQGLATQNAAAALTVAQSNPTVDSYLKRVFMFLEDGDWNNANEYCEKVLDIDPENASAYLGKFLLENKCISLVALEEAHLSCTEAITDQMVIRSRLDVTADIVDRACADFADPHYFPIHVIKKLCEEYMDQFSSDTPIREKQLAEETAWWENNKALEKIMKFADPALQQELLGIKARILDRMDARLQASVLADQQKEETAIDRLYASLQDRSMHNNLLRERDYRSVCGYSSNASSVHLESAIRTLRNLGDYKDSRKLLQEYQARLDHINKTSLQRRQLNEEKARLSAELSRMGIFSNRSHKQFLEQRLAEIEKALQLLQG